MEYQHEAPEVKLVDTSGTVRIDLNGHRVHAAPDQVRQLLVKLAGALDDGEIFCAVCTSLTGELLHVVGRTGDNGCVSIDSANTSRDEYTSVYMDEETAINAAVAILARVGEAE